MVFSASINPRKWLKTSAYHGVDLSPTWFSYPPPPPQVTPPTSQSSSPQATPTVDPIWFQGDDVLLVSLKALREIFRNFDASELPPDLAACLAGDRDAISANHAAYRLWAQQPRASTSTHPPPHQVTPPSAAPDQLCPTSITPIPTPKTLPQPTPAQPTPKPHTQPTVPRTTQYLPCEAGTPPDLALQVCQAAKNPDIIDVSRTNWDPRLLFPELCTTPTQKSNPPLCTTSTQADSLALTSDKANLTRTQISAPTGQAHPLRRTTRGRINKKANSQSGLDNLDVESFIDVPLQYEEGQKILQLIGSTSTTIPPNLLASAGGQANPQTHVPQAQTYAQTRQAQP